MIQEQNLQFFQEVHSCFDELCVTVFENQGKCHIRIYLELLIFRVKMQILLELLASLLIFKNDTF